MVKSINSSYLLSEKELEKHIKIYAGPGAGKTYFLVENVKNIISNNAIIRKSVNRKIACITYTNKAVNEIMNRLDDYNEYVESYTIHGFIIENIIKRFQSDLVRIMKDDFDIEISESKPITSQVEGLNILHGLDRDDIYSFIEKETGTYVNRAYSKKIWEKLRLILLNLLKS